MGREVPLQIAALQLTDFDQLGCRPTFSGYRIPALRTQLDRLNDRATNHLARFFDRPPLGLNLREFRNVGIDEVPFIALEYSGVATLVHRRGRYRLKPMLGPTAAQETWGLQAGRSSLAHLEHDLPGGLAVVQ